MSSSANPLGPPRPTKRAVSMLRQCLPRRIRNQGRRPGRLERKGAIAVLAAFLLVGMAGVVALSVDLGCLFVARTELQRSADSAALAAAAQMLECSLSGASWGATQEQQVREMARLYAENNLVARAVATIDLNSEQNPDGDVLLGEVVDWSGNERSLRLSQAAAYNAVQVRVARSRRINGELPLFFAHIFGVTSSAVDARATAAFVTRFRGFEPPLVDGVRQNLPMLPIAVSEESLAAMIRGEGSDDYSWDSDGQGVQEGPDGHREISLYPERTGASGNWGLVDLGSGSTSPDRLKQQIRDGLTPAEMDYHGGKLALDYQGELTLSGDPGIKIGVVEPALQSIVGQPRIIPVYRTVSAGGTNAVYTITGFVGVCIVSVQLKSGEKHIGIQTCPVMTRGGIPASPGQQTSRYIYSPVALVN